MSLTHKPLLTEIQLTNSQTHKKERFVPLTPGKVKFYSCGPTVYGPIHIGNLRAALTADLIYRFFKYAGYEVNYVRNYTDIDDKIINRAKDEKTTLEVITQRYTELVEQDYAMAMLEEPTHKTKVTEHLPEIISMIEAIIKNKKAYLVDTGNPTEAGAKSSEVFFSIDAFKEYGSLSHKPLEDLQAGARVEINTNKKNPLDFSLWKPVKQLNDGSYEPSWESPWGKGRPGWHIECSAMACKWLGNTMDIHHGGEDLVFPHHENEIAQSEAATGVRPYVKIWMHNAFLNLSGVKMSKSLGNIVSARDFLSQYGGEIARMIFLGVHYRVKFDFNDETVEHAMASLERIYEAKFKAEQIREKKILLADTKNEPLWGGFLMDCDKARKAISAHYCNDLNTAGALSEIFTLTREFNRCVAVPNAENTPSAILASNEFIKVLEEEIGAVIGVGRARADTMLKKLEEVKVLRQKAEGKTILSDQEIDGLIAERKQVRTDKNFKRSDEIRDILAAAKIEIKDSPQGTIWKRK